MPGVVRIRSFGLFEASAASHNAAMEPDEFAAGFGQLYQQVYRLAARRIADSREQLSTETTALLLHLAQSGPLSLSEMARHFDRALSTLSVKIAALEAEGLLARQRDDGDARRALVWLSPQGRAVLDQALQVLDAQRLGRAAEELPAERRRQLLDGLRELVAALSLPASATDLPPKPHPHSNRGGSDEPLV
jgi:DNA-binding MarR family transcriptional regulator